MQPYHKRMAEVWWKVQSGKKPTTRDIVEWVESHHAHMHWVSRLNRLNNWADAYSIIGDQDEESKHCQQMDDLIYIHSRGRA
ncbi:hypothetical protein IC620_15620 [Hazenella sp. IB182357]|uniref:Uncharacterized protein n=1 Tax=Polycladospora coralii TaxID=2771432 RepID=A0A926N713_9BACL|nr:hypothetical protein [Polycladospora coralii]MBD1373774.1 hypothetical protein [Polycladospora coralii]